MWLQTGNEQQWLALERRRIEALGRPARGNAAGAIAAAVRAARLLRAALEPARPGAPAARFGPPGTAW